MDGSKKLPIIPSNIEQLTSYVPGKTIAEVKDLYNPERISKLASNENRLGYSNSVKEAVEKAMETVQNYPDAQAKILRKLISKQIGVPVERIIVGAGSESIIAMLCRTFFHNKQNVVTASATFVGIFIQAKIRGIKVKKIPLNKEFKFDLKAMVQAIDEHTKMVYIANPNNPTGTYISQKEFDWLVANVPKDVLIIMDEAYYEFAVDEDNYPDVLAIEYPNVIVLRTFSKAYGLAGFRVGYAFASADLINYLYKTKLSFEPGSLGQAAASAAIVDKEFLILSKQMVREGRERLYRFLEKQKVKYIPSISNFVAIVFDLEEEALWFTEKMLEKGMILRRINAFGLPNCVRITIGVKEEMDHFEDSFREIIRTSN